MSTGIQLIIYAADVAGSVNLFSMLGTVAAVGGAIAVTIAANAFRDSEGAAWDDRQRYSHTRQLNTTERPEPKPFTFKPAKGLIIAAAALIGVNVLVPSPGTLYAIAATEVAETIVQSETATKAINALNRFLDAKMPDVERAATVTVTNAANQ